MKPKHIVAYMAEYAVVHYFEYNDASPSGLQWKVDRGVSIKQGDYAGWKDTVTGYYRVKVDGKAFQAHRVVYALANKNVAGNVEIDHIDKNRSNNEIANLREADAFINARNKTRYSNNTSGVNGVSIRDGLRYVVQWYDLGKLHSKSFSINKHGEDNAKNFAIEFRRTVESKLKYSEGHGDERETHKSIP